MKKLLFILLVCFVYAFAKAQLPDTLKVKVDSVKTSSPEYYFIDGDSVSAVELDQIMLIQKLKFDHKYERIRYLILKRKTLKVWPYAKLAAERLQELDKRLATLENTRDKKRYAKMVEKYIEEEFTAELKKLTRTEGQILIKLIHRQTGDTAFELIKRLRSGWSAFWFNNTAKIFDISLKEEYKPHMVVDDFYIEDILINAFRQETLEEQESAIPIDYFEGKSTWKAYTEALPANYDSIQLAERAKRIKKYREKKARQRKRKRS
ncbi:DUF4294 domain-containing protein [Nonlabens tegetincola]|uniref:DUF4294 domain-containing protein n=1 Tax=Nonlabens tegetincola TaxID=323273 RepID=UPI000CF5404D|nr:DUF4294 domain-containing protein [Nonlabens tegetincola]PQJ16982.1 hypothetical protein BST93_09920 [Nonlabens tegetincola]